MVYLLYQNVPFTRHWYKCTVFSYYFLKTVISIAVFIFFNQ